LHHRFKSLIESKLQRICSLEREGKTQELDEIRSESPNAIPDARMRTLWSLLLSGRVRSSEHESGLYRLIECFKSGCLTTTIQRLQLRELLKPMIALKRPFRWSPASGSDQLTTQKKLHWELTLAADDVYTAKDELDKTENWQLVLPLLLEEFQQLLRDALDLLQELDKTDDKTDRTHLSLPSISTHWQNRGYCDWVSLIELLRDSWLAALETDKLRAKNIATAWFQLPYPTFKRLALFAASQDNCIKQEQWVKWLLSDRRRWLWSRVTMREVCRLLVLKGQKLSGDTQDELEHAILAGPPRELYKNDLEANDWQNIIDHSVWLRLSKIKSSGLILGEPARIRLETICNQHSEWQLAANESDEFSYWSYGTGDPDYENSRKVEDAPRKRKELVEWLKKYAATEWSPFCEDTWDVVCGKRYYHAVAALCDLAKQNIWPIHHWGVALQIWANADIASRSLKFAGPLVLSMPDAVLEKIAHGVSWWIKVVSHASNHHDQILLELCRKILALPLPVGSSSLIIQEGKATPNPVNTALNHPIGLIIQALIDLWFKQNLKDNDGVPEWLWKIFTDLCDVQIDRFCHGRVILGSTLIFLYRIDRVWTEQNLLPLFDWNTSNEANAVWEGFLSSARLYQPVLIALKQPFLETAKNYNSLGVHSQQFATLLTYVALDQTEGFTAKEFQTAISTLPLEGLETAARTLYRAVAGAAEQCEEYWENRIRPFWRNVWPKDRKLVTPEIARYLAHMVLATRDKFPTALNQVKAWLIPVKDPVYLVSLLHKSNHCQRFPAQALQLLDAIVDGNSRVSDNLGNCLDQIQSGNSTLAADQKYIQLRAYCQKI